MSDTDPFIALEARRVEAEKIRMAVTSPAWTEVILPFLEHEKLARANELVAATCAEKPDALRIVGLGNRVATLEWVRTRLMSKIKEFDLEYAQEQARQDRDAADNRAAAELVEHPNRLAGLGTHLGKLDRRQEIRNAPGGE